MSLTTVASVTASRIRTSGPTIFRRIFKSSLGSIINSQYPDTRANRCICSHRIPVDQGRKLYKSTLTVRPYHNREGNPKDDDSDDSVVSNTNIADEVDREKETSHFSSTAPGSINDNFVPFENQTRVIQDVLEQEWNPIPISVLDPKAFHDPVNLERGQTGVFDLEELVALLREQNARDTCVIAIPKEMKYADYMVIVTARSPKHMFALATFIRRRFKMKERKSSDKLPKIEGSQKNKDWIAMDLGNIALHVFTVDAREQMDLETLWTVGPLFDDLVNTKDTEIVQLLNLFSSRNPTNPKNSPSKSKK